MSFGHVVLCCSLARPFHWILVQFWQKDDVAGWSNNNIAMRKALSNGRPFPFFVASSPPWFHVVLMGGCFAGSSLVSLIRTVVDSVPSEWGWGFCMALGSRSSILCR